jgi:uncharacterized protein YaaQ
MAGKMVMCIVHREDTEELTRALNVDGYRVTRATTTGGFLRQGNVSLMIGVDETQVDDVLTVIRENTHPRSRRGWWARPGQHEEGAATVFVVDMEQVRLPE